MKNFELVPTIHKARSKQDLSHNINTTFNMGDLVPLDITEVIPGDTFKTKLTAVIRTSSPFTKPIFGNMYMDVYSFFIPFRLCYEDATKIFGNPSPSAYIDNELLSIPATTSPQTVYSGTVADYLGLPLGNIPSGINIMPFRAFARVYNEWFRDQNVVDEVYQQLGEYNVGAETFNNKEWSPNNYTGKLPKVRKKKDYFTSCLPSPQKGSAVTLPVASGFAPVTNVNDTTNRFSPVWLNSNGDKIGSQNLANTTPYFLYPMSEFGNTYHSTGYGKLVDEAGSSTGPVIPYQSGRAYLSLGANLEDITFGNINDFRFAFQLQRMLELDARGGSRYNEYLNAHYGVTSPDARLQFTEFLGGGRIPISIQEVNQTAPVDGKGVGNQGAFSLSMGSMKYVKGFVEHGYVLTVGCVRSFHSYQQGIPKMFMRSNRNDIYDPLFAHLGQQPVYLSEIYGVNRGQSLKQDVFGYTEAWADYRYKPNSITGQFRSGITNSLDVWHLGDIYNTTPYLSKEFVEENTFNIDRVLSVPSTSQDNFIFDGFMQTTAIRVMPVHSVPGLVDHTY